MTVSATVQSLPTKSNTRALRRLRPLGTVLGWEVRRLAAARSTWITLAIAFAVSCLTEVLFRAATQYPITYPGGATRTFWIDWGSNYGLFNTLPQAPGMYLGLYLPFVATDGVARELKRRTHELVMTTPIPSWAYVWGRYLSALLLSVALAVVMLAALVAVAAVRHQAQPDIYLVPDLPGVVALWAAITLPPTVLLCSVSFALGTLLPRRSTLIKLAVMLSWFIIANITGRTAASCGDCAIATGDAVRRAAWDPSSLALSFLQTPDSLLHQLATQTQSLSNVAFLEYLHALERQLPDISAWILPHTLWALGGMGVVFLATLLFHRFRGM